MSIAEETARSGEAFVDAVERVADHSMHILQDELTLARLEMVEKLPLLAGGLVRAVLGVATALIGLLLGSFAIAFVLADYVFGDHLWAGFAVVAVLLLVVAVVLVRLAWSKSQAAMPPVPTQAIDQAGKLRAALRRRR